MSYTSIQIRPETRMRLARLKSSPRETYDDVINKLLDLIPSGDNEGEYTDEFRASLLRARLDMKHGKLISLEEAKSILGIE